MKLDAKTLAEHCYFAENLKAAVSELAVTQAELARAVGKDQKTVGRYISGETYPEGCVAQIAEYLASRSVDNDFVHIPSEKFEKLFSDIYDFLQDNGIPETEFAEMIGISQKTLNNYKNYHLNNKKTLRLSTETQHKIVDAFERLGMNLFLLCPEDDEARADIRGRYNNIRWELSDDIHKDPYAVQETWTCLIKGYKSGTNFFVYSRSKLELVCFYLHYLISELNTLWSMNYNELNRSGKCRNYYLRKDVASLDFMFSPHEDLEDEDFGAWKDGDDQTPNFWCGLVCSDTESFRKTHGALSPREKDEINALLRKVYISKTRKIKQEREYLKTLNLTPLYFETDSFFDSKEIISDEETEALCEMFAALPNEIQHVIISSFGIFFYGINFKNIAETTAAHKRLRALSHSGKLDFINKFEKEILSGFWEAGMSLNDRIVEKYFSVIENSWDYCSQYMMLMSYALNVNTYSFSPPSKELARRFREKIVRLPKDLEPLAVMKAQLEYSAMDWYVNMLADIALLKGIKLDEMLSAVE